MGASMCKHLIEKKGAEYDVRIHTRTEEKAKHLLGPGVTYFWNPLEMVRECDFVFTMLGDPTDLR